MPFFLCEFFGLPSSVGNLAIVCAGLLYSLCYTLIPHFWYRECRGFGSPPLAVRAGVVSTALVPFIYILSGKSNLICGLTGISYEKINVHHRWVSIISYIAAWVHTAPFYIQSSREGGLERLAYMQKNNVLFRTGIPPIVFMTILCILSHSYFRVVWYELFIHLHWISAVGFYIGLIYHCFQELNTEKYMYATVVFWITQLVYRAVVKSCFKPNKGFLKANPCKISRFMSSSPDNQCYQILIENTNEFHWVPGQHLFLRFPGLRVLDNHPFSILSLYEPSEDGKIKLVIKPMHGLTRKIYDSVPETGFLDGKVFVEGPYGGCERDYNSFDSLFLVASGTGIAATLPFLLKASQDIVSGNTKLHHVRLDWIIRDNDSVEWIVPELTKLIQTVPKKFFDDKRKLK
ncbi:unnamed protein product [Ambrosiozyma monospora]|uniref:Unnamed protein product n=1 Tax=Ambrosiozyma monospora TaxID=43982 RepID=A0ACB5TWW4_AMBMO|nr:unnamed protein product [Ambrosiozyma monospora]